MQLLEETCRDEGAAVALHDWLDQTPLALCPLEHMPVKEIIKGLHINLFSQRLNRVSIK